MNIILLSGGSGRRLWPLSNDVRAKQFIKLFKRDDGQYESMVQRVYRQIKQVDTAADITIAAPKSQISSIHFTTLIPPLYFTHDALFLP